MEIEVGQDTGKADSGAYMDNFDGQTVAWIVGLFLFITYNEDNHEKLHILDELAIQKLDQGGVAGEKDHKDIGIPHKDDAFVDLMLDRKLEVDTYTLEN